MRLIPAHLGHFGEAAAAGTASHDHWIAGAAIAVAVAAGLWGWLGRKDDAPEAEAAPDAADAPDPDAGPA